VAICATCGQANPEGARFCNACAAPLDAAAVEREQRKTVSIVFCDLTGSTELGESTDPEALRAILARYFERMKGIVESHGGSVEKFIGDAVMAVFGVPVAHEDDALRACRAAVEMRAALPELGIAGRIGVNTGEVVTGTGERLATGDAVNVAARLEQAAQAGEVLVGDATLRLVRAAVEVGDERPLKLKGKRGPDGALRRTGLTVPRGCVRWAPPRPRPCEPGFLASSATCWVNAGSTERPETGLSQPNQFRSRRCLTSRRKHPRSLPDPLLIPRSQVRSRSSEAGRRIRLRISACRVEADIIALQGASRKRMPSEQTQLSVRAVNRWNLLRVQLLGDLLKRHPLPEHRVDLPPQVVTLVADPMREPNVVRGEVTSVHLEPRIVVGRRRPIGKRRSRLEVPTASEAVALGHLAPDVDELAAPRKLQEDSANAEGLELLDWSFFNVRRCRWASCLRDLLFVIHDRALIPRRAMFAEGVLTAASAAL
jgi:class 3 adenylate cyclase